MLNLIAYLLFRYGYLLNEAKLYAVFTALSAAGFGACVCIVELEAAIVQNKHAFF